MAADLKTTYFQMVFSVLKRPIWLIWNCPKNYLSVQMS